MKPISYAHFNIFHKKGYWFKIWMEFLRQILAKIKLICQQPAMPQLSGVQGVANQPWGAGLDGWGLMGWSGYVSSSLITYHGKDFISGFQCVYSNTKNEIAS